MARLGDGERDKTRKPKALNESERERWEGELIRAWAFYLPEIKRVCCVCLDMLTLLSKLKVQQEKAGQKFFILLQSCCSYCSSPQRLTKKRFHEKKSSPFCYISWVRQGKKLVTVLPAAKDAFIGKGGKPGDAR